MLAILPRQFMSAAKMTTLEKLPWQFCFLVHRFLCMCECFLSSSFILFTCLCLVRAKPDYRLYLLGGFFWFFCFFIGRIKGV